MTLVKFAIQGIHEDLTSRLTSRRIEEVGSTTGPIEVEEEDGETYEEILTMFPIKNIEDFQSFDVKLNSDQHRKQVVSVYNIYNVHHSPANST